MILELLLKVGKISINRLSGRACKSSVTPSIKEQHNCRKAPHDQILTVYRLLYLEGAPILYKKNRSPKYDVPTFPNLFLEIIGKYNVKMLMSISLRPSQNALRPDLTLHLRQMFKAHRGPKNLRTIEMAYTAYSDRYLELEDNSHWKDLFPRREKAIQLAGGWLIKNYFQKYFLCLSDGKRIIIEGSSGVLFGGMVWKQKRKINSFLQG